MTALEKLLAAMESDHEPAPGTYRDALVELERQINESFATIVRCAEMRGRLEAYAGISRVVSDVAKEAHQAEESTVTPLHREVAMCSICGTREARVWDENIPYCKRCARNEGVVITGKV